MSLRGQFRMSLDTITGYSFRRTARRSRDNGWAASGGTLKVERCLLYPMEPTVTYLGRALRYSRSFAQ
jgi:hypothetical protein